MPMHILSQRHTHQKQKQTNKKKLKKKTKPNLESLNPFRLMISGESLFRVYLLYKALGLVISTAINNKLVH